MRCAQRAGRTQFQALVPDAATHAKRSLKLPILPSILLALARVHADTHGQSAAVFGLAYLLGIERMPRIRRWHKLKLYRSDAMRRYQRIGGIFSGTVDWSLIARHYDEFMQLALGIQRGALAPSAVL